MCKKRCFWLNENNDIYVEYHDKEWGVPVYNDEKLFEMLVLESFQAGLSWETILNKRESFRKAFDNFDVEKVSKYDLEKVNDLLLNSDIVRNRLKIQSAINNAKVFIEIQKDYESFSNYIWSFTNKKIIYENDKTSSSLSDEISLNLKKRGMKFVGTTIIYSYLQAIGVIYSHDDDCFLAIKNK